MKLKLLGDLAWLLCDLQFQLVIRDWTLFIGGTGLEIWHTGQQIFCEGKHTGQQLSLQTYARDKAFFDRNRNCSRDS